MVLRSDELLLFGLGFECCLILCLSRSFVDLVFIGLKKKEGILDYYYCDFGTICLKSLILIILGKF